MMIKDIVRKRLYQSTPHEIVHYSHEYNLPLTLREASTLLNFIKHEKIDPFSEKDRFKTLQYIQVQLGQQTAQEAEQLLIQLIKQYNLHYLM